MGTEIEMSLEDYLGTKDLFKRLSSEIINNDDAELILNIKAKAQELYDLIRSREYTRELAIAIAHLETAIMFFTKGVAAKYYK